MGNIFVDDKPVLTNEVVEDFNNMRDTFGFLKDAFQAVGAGWSNTDATNYKGDKISSSFAMGDSTKTVAVDTPAAASSSVITVSSGGLYQVDFYLSTDDFLSVRVNADSGSNYSYTFSKINSVAVYSDESSLSATGMKISQDAGVSGYVVGSFIFCGLIGDNQKAGLVGTSTSLSSSSLHYTINRYGGGYDGAAEVTSMTIYPDSGTITGKIVCERLF